MILLLKEISGSLQDIWSVLMILKINCEKPKLPTTTKSKQIKTEGEELIKRLRDEANARFASKEGE